MPVVATTVSNTTLGFAMADAADFTTGTVSLGQCSLEVSQYNAQQQKANAGFEYISDGS